MHAQIILTDRPSVNSAMGVIAFDAMGKPVRCLVNNRILNDFGMLGLKRGIKTTTGEVRLSEEHLHHEDVLGTVEKTAAQLGCDVRVHVEDLKD